MNKFIVLALLFIGCVNDAPDSLVWTGRGYVTFGDKSSDTVSCKLVLHGGSGTLTMKRDAAIVLQDTLFNVLADNFKYSGSVRSKYDTATFEFYDFSGAIEGSYGLDPDNGVYFIRHFTLARQ
jgi:hypothetical protein